MVREVGWHLVGLWAIFDLGLLLKVASILLANSLTFFFATLVLAGITAFVVLAAFRKHGLLDESRGEHFALL